ncbi:MAG: hypothetical protein ABW208_14790 [Pyrinomonadaceae bacterium]
MSDYLWDKKGEPDADVARLETLLGTFKHAPRALELPAEPATPEPRRAGLLHFAPRLRASRLFAPVALAAAAALLVASVLVASAFLRARVPTSDERADAPESPRPKKEEAPKDDAPKGVRPEQREVVRRMLEPPPPVGGVKDKTKVESVAVGNLSNGARQRKDAQPSVATTRRRPKLPDAVTGGAGAGEGLTLEAMRSGLSGSALVENTRLLTKEQLVYALRLTGTKLRDVREKAQGTEGSRQ